jgi:hypothetical protein
MKRILSVLPGVGYFFTKRKLKGLVVLGLFGGLAAYSILGQRFVPQAISLAIGLWLAYIIDVNGS